MMLVVIGGCEMVVGVVNNLEVRLDEVVEYIAYAETSSKSKPVISKDSIAFLEMLAEGFGTKDSMLLIFEGAVHNVYSGAVLRCMDLDKIFEKKGCYIYSMVNDIVNQHYEGCWKNMLSSITNAESKIPYPQDIKVIHSQECITRKPEGLFRKAVSSLEHRVWLNRYYDEYSLNLTQKTLIDLIDCKVINSMVLSSELKAEVISYICNHIREKLYSKYKVYFMYIDFESLILKLNH